MGESGGDGVPALERRLAEEQVEDRLLIGSAQFPVPVALYNV